MFWAAFKEALTGRRTDRTVYRRRKKRKRNGMVKKLPDHGISAAVVVIVTSVGEQKGEADSSQIDEVGATRSRKAPGEERTLSQQVRAKGTTKTFRKQELQEEHTCSESGMSSAAR